jgi:hypothetical protein
MLDKNPDHHTVEEAQKRVKQQTRMGRNGQPMDGWMNDIPGESVEQNASRLKSFDKDYRIANNQREQGKK